MPGLGLGSALGLDSSAAPGAGGAVASIYTSLLRYTPGGGTHAFTPSSTNRSVICIGSGANGGADGIYGGGGSGAVAITAIANNVVSGTYNVDDINNNGSSSFTVSAVAVCVAASGVDAEPGQVVNSTGDTVYSGEDGSSLAGGNVAGGFWYSGVGGVAGASTENGTAGGYYGAGGGPGGDHGGSGGAGAPGLVVVIEKVSGLWVTTYYLLNGTGAFKFFTGSTLREFTCIGSGDGAGGGAALSITSVGSSEIVYQITTIDPPGNTTFTEVRLDDGTTTVCLAESGGNFDSGDGGRIAGCTGDTKHSGGNVGTSSVVAGGGGGGAGGRTGNGSNGGNAVILTPGAAGAAGAGGSYSGDGGSGGGSGLNGNAGHNFGGGGGRADPGADGVVNGTPGEGVVIAVETHI